MTRRRSRWSPLLVSALGACSVPATVAQLGEQNPPPQYGRPGWVQTSADAGAWIGGAIGSAGAIALLPISWPLTELCGEQLREEAKEQLLWFPATGLAAVGHAAFGAPADMFDYTLRRAWIGREDPVAAPEIGPLAEPELPAPATVEADR